MSNIVGRSRCRWPFCLLMFLVAVLAHPIWAADQCVALLAQGIRDTSSTQLSESRFNEIKSNVCTSSFDSYNKAASQAINGGFDVPGLFGISAGDSNASSEYSLKWSTFCAATYGESVADTQLKSYFATANQAVLHSFDNCVATNAESFIRYVDPQADGKTFAIVFNNRKQGNASFVITNITLTNSTTGKTVKVQDACDKTTQFPWNTAPLNAISIVCRKSASDQLIVNATTDAGNIAPVTVAGVPSPGPGISDRVAALEGQSQQMQKALALASAGDDVLMSQDAPSVFLAKHHDDGSVWKLCDGSPGTLNLVGRYPRGFKSGLTPALGATQDQSLQDHTHSLVGWATMNDASGGGDNHVLRTGYGGSTSTSGIDESSIKAGETRPPTTILNFYCRVH